MLALLDNAESVRQTVPVAAWALGIIWGTARAPATIISATKNMIGLGLFRL